MDSMGIRLSFLTCVRSPFSLVYHTRYTCVYPFSLNWSDLGLEMPMAIFLSHLVKIQLWERMRPLVKGRGEKQR